MYDRPFTKENLDLYLRELAKEYRKRNGRGMPAEIVLIGGAAILLNYGFRGMTYDTDAIISAASSMKDAVNAVADRYSLPNGWMNADFMRTPSYTPAILRHSKYYRTYANVVTFRTVCREYLIAMKLMAGRRYKNDLSDVVGILWDHERNGDPVRPEEVRRAAADLYGSYEALPEGSRTFFESVTAAGGYERLYREVRAAETENREALLAFQQEYPGTVNMDNADEILDAIRRKKERD